MRERRKKCNEEEEENKPATVKSDGKREMEMKKENK